MTIKLRTNLIGGLLGLIIAAIIWFVIPVQVKVMQASTYSVDARFMPRLVTLIIALMSIVLLIQSLVLKKERIVDIIIKEETRVIVFYLILVAYVVLIPIIGFLISTLLISLGTLLYLRCKRKSYYIITGVIVAGIYLAFIFLLNVPLP